MLDASLKQRAAGSVQKQSVQCKGDSVHGAADPASVRQLVVQGNENSVHKLRTTELANKLEPTVWRTPLIISAAGT
jgi:hypothetical protein